MICSGDCGRDINPNTPGVFQKVTGWTERRVQGGSNAIRLPEPHREIMCKACMDKLARGQTRGQERLL